MSRVAVTGAAGYVGGRLVRELEDQGESVLAIIRRPVAWLDSVDQRIVDVAAEDRLTDVLDGVDCVVHLAGPNEVEAARNPDRALAETIIGTRHAAEAAATSGVRTFVYLSTMHVYGAVLRPGARITEEVAPAPRAAYSIARLASEHIAMAASTKEMDTVVLRLTNSIGAPAHHSVQRWTLVVNDLCRQAVLSGKLVLQSDGTQYRDFVPLTDVCRIVADIARDGLASGTYNMGSGVPTTVRQIADTVAEIASTLLGTRPTVIAPAPAGLAPEPYCIGIGKLAAAGHRPTGTVADAIEETLRFCIEWREDLEP